MTLTKPHLYAVFLTALLVAALPAPSLAAMNQAQVRAALEKDYDVKVLKITPGADAKRRVFIVKIMYNGGNFNTAFQVNTIVVDAETGKRISQFRHGPSGRSLPGTFDSVPNRQRADALRGHIWR
jgi:hypothetical protein